MTGKQKCKILKEIRRQIAEANDIRYVIEECTHKGKCRGTCPKCEWEVRMLEWELEKRRLSGKKVALAGISAGMIVSSATACTPVETVREMLFGTTLQGEVMVEYDGVDVPPDTTPELEGETEVVEPLLGDPVVEIPGEVVEEGVIAIPESEIDEEEIVVLAGVPLYEEETDPAWDETLDADELILEGDVAFPFEEDAE